MRYVLVATACVLFFACACSSGAKPPLQPGSQTNSTSASGISKASLDALNAGLQALAAGRLDEAATDYRQALVLDPRNKFAYFDLGVIDQNAGKATAAESDYLLALQLDPNFAPALFNLAVLRTVQGQTAQAIDLYRRAAAASPNDAGIHLNLGVLLTQAGQTAEGNAEIARARQLDPKLAATPTATAVAPARVATP